MTTATLAAPAPRPVIKPTAAIGIWWAIPVQVRRAIGATVPLDCRDYKDGTESLIVAVGPGVPVRWLQCNAADTGEIEVRLWELRRKGMTGAAGAVVTAKELPALLLKWAAQFNMGGG